MRVRMDKRWIGAHGIGRFAAEISARQGYASLEVSGNPASPLDPARLAWACLRAPADTVMFSPGYSAPLYAPMPFIITVHDLNHIDRDENSSALKRLYYARVLRPACKRAAAILTVSEFSRSRIVDWTGVDPRKVINVGNGVAEPYGADGERHAPGYPYLLCVSNRKRHKNEAAVVQAFAQARLPRRIRLVMTGVADDELAQQISRLGIADRVVFTGRVAEAFLPVLYRGATALVFPSLYEGFGLPVIEAFACGTPVITSTTTSLPEVAGDAALLVDPLSIDAIADAVERVVADESLRRTMTERGQVRAARFTWAGVAAQVGETVDAVCKGLRPGAALWPSTADTSERPPWSA